MTWLGALFEFVTKQLSDSPPTLDRIFFFVVHLMKAGVMTAAVALKAGCCFDRVDHEAEAWAGSGDHGGFVAAWTAGRDVGHLVKC